jgi:DNA-binding response OmpR family regulator
VTFRGTASGRPGRSPRGSRVAHQPEDRCRSAIDRAILPYSSALGELGDIERAIEAGTDDFLSKPVNRVELVKRVENMLTLRHVSDELQRLRSYIRTMDDDQPPW